QANGGTLFLDEIGDMPLPLQAKILRVLQEREVRSVGGNVLRKVDVRVVAATHRNLEEMVGQGRFREDLLSRLRGYVLDLPPLRDRGRDVIILARLFLHASKEGSGKSLGHDARALLLSYRWPGNIRELQHAIQAAAVDAPGGIGAQHLRRHLRCIENAPVEVGVSIEQKILAAIETRGQTTLAQLHTDLKVPKPTLHRYLGRLQGDGQVRRFCKNEAVWFAVGGEDSVLLGTLLPDRQSQAMAFIGREGRITRQQYADIFGVSIRTASRDLSDMLSNGRLRLDSQPGKLAGYQACL
ncbi:MAG: sigma 54-interacting transcriptional regulator, partial [Magnetococcus sp. YQC-3]